MILGQDAVILRSAQLVHHGLVCENVRVHNINELRTVGLEETMLLCRISARATRDAVSLLRGHACSDADDSRQGGSVKVPTRERRPIDYRSLSCLRRRLRSR